MNVGTSVAAYFERAGITRIDELAGKDPVELYDAICRIDARRHDPCLLDTIMSAVDQANGNPARPWWTYTPHRKQLLTSQANTASRQSQRVSTGRSHATARGRPQAPMLPTIIPL